MSSPLAEQLVEAAVAALRRLAEAPPAAEATRATLVDVRARWPARPLRVGIGGDNPAVRGIVLDAACGGAFATRSAGAPPVLIRRGATTRFRVLRDGGAAEERVHTPADSSAVDVARAEVVGRQHELAGIERGIPGLVLARPRPWMFWLWPVRWWRRWRARAALEAREQATAALAAAQQGLAQLEARQVDPVGARALFLADALAARGAIAAIEVELADGPLPGGVEMNELAGANRAEADVDAVLISTRDGVLAPVSGSAPVRVGDVAQVIRALPGFLVHARALNLARRAVDRLDAARAKLDGILRQAEIDFDVRVDRVEALRVHDPAALRAQQLEQLQSKVLGQVATIMEHAATHLGTELAKLAASWTELFARATSTEHLTAAVTQIDAQWREEAKRIADEVRALVTSGIAGSAHDLHGELIAPLRELGFAEWGRRPAPAVAPVALLPSLSNPTTARWGGAAEWLVGLFRSFESRREDIAAKAEKRAEHLRTVAQAELLDAQPLLHATLADTLGAELDAAVARHGAQVHEQLAATQAAIARERAALAPLQHARDVAAEDSRELDDRIAHLEAELPGTAAASAAARLSVGSIAGAVAG